MKNIYNSLLFFSALLVCSCAASNKNYNPAKKYSRQALQQDYTLLRNILEKKHPSLYWYTSKDSMDMYFDKYYNVIADSMTEQQFGWKVLAPLIDNIHCGHTSFSMSKAYNHWVQNKRFPSFPLYMKVWNDTMVVTDNINRKDSLIRRGAIIKEINGLNTAALTKTMFGYMAEDGYAANVNYIRLSANFPYYHRNIFGLSKNYEVKYLDTTGNEHTTILPLFEFKRDSLNKKLPPVLVKKPKKEKRSERLKQLRSLEIDTANNTALITLNTFTNGSLRKFFRQSFKYIRRAGITNVVLDIRTNGGGKINLSTLLTRYVTRRPFKVADTAFAVAQTLHPYTKYIRGGFFNNLGLVFSTSKQADGLYHFRHWERKLYHPKTTNHFGGDLYVLINGPTFSASTLFCNAIKGQPGITLVGEEAGGGWHGNDGVMIPDITLPNTKLRVRLPLFRLVQYKHVPKNGLGVMPDVYVGTSYEALEKGYDKKKQVVMELIKSKQQ